MTRQGKFRIVTDTGLHARPATRLAREAGRWQADVKLASDLRTVDAKSIMGLLSLAAGRGTILTLTVSGDQAGEAFAALERIFLDGLAEPA